NDPDRRRAFFTAAAQATAAAWPHAQVATAESVPFPWNYGSTRFQIDNRAAANPRQLPRANYNAVAPEFFATMRIPLLAGRFFAERDSTGPALKVIVNDALVKQQLAGQNPIGHHVRVSVLADREGEIIGVVPEIQVSNDTRNGFAQLYVPFGQSVPRSAAFVV